MPHTTKKGGENNDHLQHSQQICKKEIKEIQETQENPLMYTDVKNEKKLYKNTIRKSENHSQHAIKIKSKFYVLKASIKKIFAVHI